MSILFHQCQAHTSAQTLTVKLKVHNNRSILVNPHEPDYWDAPYFSLPPLLMAHLVSAVPIQVPFFHEEVQCCSVKWRLPSPSGHVWSCPLALLQLSWWGHFHGFSLADVSGRHHFHCCLHKEQALHSSPFHLVFCCSFWMIQECNWQPMMIKKGFWSFHHSLRLRTFVVDFS